MGAEFSLLEPRNTGVALGYNASLAVITALFCFGQNRDFVHNIKKKKNRRCFFVVSLFLWLCCGILAYVPEGIVGHTVFAP